MDFLCVKKRTRLSLNISKFQNTEIKKTSKAKQSLSCVPKNEKIQILTTKGQSVEIKKMNIFKSKFWKWNYNKQSKFTSCDRKSRCDSKNLKKNPQKYDWTENQDAMYNQI